MSCDETLFCVKVSLLRYTFFHLSPELNPRKVFDFHEISAGSSVVNAFRVFHFFIRSTNSTPLVTRWPVDDCCKTDKLKQLTPSLLRAQTALLNLDR